MLKKSWKTSLLHSLLLQNQNSLQELVSYSERLEVKDHKTESKTGQADLCNTGHSGSVQTLSSGVTEAPHVRSPSSTTRSVRPTWAPGGPLRAGCSRTREEAESDGTRAAPRRHLEGSGADLEAKAAPPRAQLPAGYCREALPARRRRSPLGLPRVKL